MLSSPLDVSAIEQRIEDLLAQMTLDEKVSLCHAGSKFAVAAIPRLGIPEFSMSDGPHGVRQEICKDSWDPVDTEEDRATYLPTGTALAATWNPEAAYRFGTVLGAEARHRGKDIILGPGINIVRTPLCGRNFEYYGEDPFHIAKLVVPEIRGIQSQPVAACVKHYAANSQELNRHGVDARMDERTLREIYLPGFEAAVIEGGSITVMGAYNKFRGQYCCHNAYLVNDILKGEWGYDGCYISDWAGVKDTVEAANFGCDIEMGTSNNYENFFLARPFREAIQRGELDEELVNDKVRRNLRAMFRAGVFDPDRPPGERNTAKHHQVALEIAREAIVLLKNEGAVLPLDRKTLKRLVVIGDNAVTRHSPGGQSSGVKALYEITPLEGLRSHLDDSVEIQFFQGYPTATGESEHIDTRYLGIADEGAGTHGWKAAYWQKRSFTGDVIRRAEAAVDFEWNDSAPFAGSTDQFSAKWETVLTPPETGSYDFVLEGAHQACLVIDDNVAIYRVDGGAVTTGKSLELEANRAYKLRIDVWHSRPGLRVRLGWIPPWARKAESSDEELLAAVQSADAVLFFGGLSHQYDLEGADRKDMQLHEGQNELIAKIAGLNPKTAVILVSGSPVEMPWVDQIPAIVQMWYAGMEGGNAVADVVLGDVNPSGKLPMTFPKRLADSPGHALNDYEADVCHYKEGIFVGYRWFDAEQIEPLFPFGHGLSYTQFALSDIEVATTGDGATVSLTVTNTGPRAGTEVVQIYVGQPKCSIERPVRELKGFVKVPLQSGESRRVEILLNPRAFAFWSVEKNGWTVEPGEFVIEAGVSSRNLTLRKVLYVSAPCDASRSIGG
ncbi:MAG TPA: glycoside hydrolase family 3 C-terminal domain-containing protein [Chthoniobacterales bacterium]